MNGMLEVAVLGADTVIQPEEPSPSLCPVYEKQLAQLTYYGTPHGSDPRHAAASAFSVGRIGRDEVDTSSCHSYAAS